MHRRCSAIMIALLSVGCTNALDTDPETGLVPSHEEGSVIVGSVGWTDITLLEDDATERANSRAVGYLSIPARGQRCTAFLIAPDVVMTNEHCIPGDWAAEGASVSFRRETGVAPAQQLTWQCSTFLGNDPGLDFALLQCDGRPGDVVGVLPLEARDVSLGESLYVIHQNCDYYSAPGCDPVKQYSPGKVSRDSQEVGHDADTLGGSSGAPVFAADTHAVFALHHVGVGGTGGGRGFENRAVPMTAILPVLAARFPSLDLGSGPSQAAVVSDAPLVEVEADAFEPNDVGDEAPFVTAPFSASAAIGTSSDRDLFVFDTGGDQRRVRIHFSHAVGDLDLYLWTASGALVARSESTTDVEEIVGALAAGRYIVEVRGYAGATGTYSLGLN